MARPILRVALIAFVALCLGVAGTAMALTLIPDPGSPPSIYDDFNFSSIGNGYWHTHSYGATARIADGLLTIQGDSMELDKRFQTDPKETVISARLRAGFFHKMGLGIGSYHSGTIGLEIDSDGIKCGRGTDFGYQVDPVVGWTTPPTGKWLYVQMSVINPYPTTAEQVAADNLPPDQLKRPTIRCSAWDATGKLIGTDVATTPPPNTHYVSLDEAYIRTWDSHNNYQIDWIYAGPPSGDPLNHLVRGGLS
jgi:hypothetical protein